jgi:hypothetical protein
MAVGPQGDVTIQETTVSGGFFPINGGGGLFNSGGTVILTQSTISGNSANGQGGGVFNSGTMTLTQSTISDNGAALSNVLLGGGVFNSGTLTLTQSTISGNSTRFCNDGGGVYNAGTLTLTQSTISGNSAPSFQCSAGSRGGGLFNSGGTMTLTQSTVSGNTARDGGGVHNAGTLTLTQSTISGNRHSNFLDGRGGGVFNSGTVTLAHTLVSGNESLGGEILSSGGTVIADHFNLFGFDGRARVVGFAPGPTDVVPGAGVLLADILDSTLADNGGPTLTHALVAESPAVDALPPGACPPPATDQRGFGRPADGDGDGTATCDIGAVEFLAAQGSPNLVETAVSTPPATAQPGSRFAVTDTARNQGTAPAGASTTRYYFSLNTTKGAGDKRLGGSRVVPGLAPGALSTGTVTTSVPAGTADGVYFLLACADDRNLVPETSESDNCRASGTRVRVTGPDLVAAAVSNPPGSLRGGGSFRVTDTARNQGTAPAGVTTTRYYFSLNTTKGAGDPLLTGSRVVPSLGPGAQSTGRVLVTLPAGTAAGVYFLLACADDTRGVPESTETNNCRAAVAQVTVAP